MLASRVRAGYATLRILLLILRKLLGAPSMPSTASIGLVLEYDIGYCRSVLHGIKRYAESRPHWVLIPTSSEMRAVQDLANLRPQGIINYGGSKAALEILRNLRRPRVRVGGGEPDDGTPRVGPNDFLIGQLAATHLLDLGLKKFAFIGHSPAVSSARREQGFRWAIERAGHQVESYDEGAPWHYNPWDTRWALGREFRSWVESLPTPVGVAANHDVWIFHLSEICRDLGLHVPEEVAMIGAANDELLCGLARPSLSSVAFPSEQIGYEAAALLDRLIAGEPPPDRPILLPPLGVVARQSSDILAIADPEVAAAVRMIRQSGPAPLQVEDVVRAASVCRRTLELRFRQSLGRGIFEEIQRVRVDRAASLLAGTDMPISVLAEQAGFSSGMHLMLAFRRETGMTPTAYRRQFRSPKARRTARV
jgi:LacI family transcriptional regulator